MIGRLWRCEIGGDLFLWGLRGREKRRTIVVEKERIRGCDMMMRGRTSQSQTRTRKLYSDRKSSLDLFL